MDEKQQQMKKKHRNDGLRKLCGCSRKKWSGCRHAWHFNYRARGSSTSHRLSLDRHFKRHIDSKTEATRLAAQLRDEIDSGTFGQAAPLEGMTLQQLVDTYSERELPKRADRSREEYEYLLGRICRTVVPRPASGAAPFGEWRLADIVTDTVERFREARRADGTGVVGTNRYLGRLRALFNWGIRTGYVERTPFKRHGEAVVKLQRETARSRRLHADEEPKLLAHTNPHLYACIVAALETGMRRGEILGLRWRQVEGLKVKDDAVTWSPRAALELRAAETKTRKARRIPISARLRAVLEIRRFDPAGKPLPLDAHVFGTALGEPVVDFKRAWITTVLKAHGLTAKYVVGSNPDAATRAAMATIDLHFHDLRREAGSRWLEGGVPLHTVKDWLGHTNISQTSTYLAGTIQTQHDAMAAFEARRAVCNDLATDAGSQGQVTSPAATQQDKNASKTTVGHATAIM